jgi:hypothetical protein
MELTSNFLAPFIFCVSFTLLKKPQKKGLLVSRKYVCMYRTRAIITRGLYTFYPLFEVHLCTVTFGFMYG